jgi:hypothetical protein
VNRASILYDKMVNDFTNETLANAATTTNSNLIISMTSLEEQDEVGDCKYSQHDSPKVKEIVILYNLQISSFIR